jgi:hypothetical protein
VKPDVNECDSDTDNWMSKYWIRTEFEKALISDSH